MLARASAFKTKTHVLWKVQRAFAIFWRLEVGALTPAEGELSMATIRRPACQRSAYYFHLASTFRYNLGIYVSEVDVGGVAHEGGLLVGDLVLSVSGVTLVRAKHAVAIDQFATNRELSVTFQRTGAIPKQKVKVGAAQAGCSACAAPNS
jgi:S1-C subfamily serine protease